MVVHSNVLAYIRAGLSKGQRGATAHGHHKIEETIDVFHGGQGGRPPSLAFWLAIY